MILITWRSHLHHVTITLNNRTYLITFLYKRKFYYTKNEIIK